ncbi:DUF167 domain-containing protein [Fulvimarina endophytica]|uniref:UPF0235 protein DYI37_09720 n=1 Tax=Fulvimarina endophytica TaxID=2293836 RepID=A0A371X269_9HYPH|nr:DUF167 family protein [Fulvimarina endophytica]RFC63322.1 DUF167 domain-containing protein [Fulvimarina endophytica]
MADPFFETARDGIRLFVRLTPKSSADRLDAVAEDGAGRLRLKARVRALPEDGRANAALAALLARAFGCAKSDVAVVAGVTSRSKTVHLRGEAERLAAIAEGLAGA